MVTVRFPDDAIADFFDRKIDEGLTPDRFFRVWLHTHPGHSVTPSSTDEITFHDAFGGCDWSVMGIVGRTGNRYARLHFAAGPGASLRIPVRIDWARWQGGGAFALDELIHGWQQEYAANVHSLDLQSFRQEESAADRQAGPKGDQLLASQPGMVSSSAAADHNDGGEFLSGFELYDEELKQWRRWR